MVRGVFPGAGGGSATTTLHLAYSPELDPLVSVPVGVLVYFIKQYVRHQHVRDLFQEVWAAALHQLQRTTRRWSVVKGPVTVVACTVLDLGWEPLRPHLWRDDAEQTLQLVKDMNP